MLQNNGKERVLRIFLKRHKYTNTQAVAHMCDNNTFNSLIYYHEMKSFTKPYFVVEPFLSIMALQSTKKLF